MNCIYYFIFMSVYLFLFRLTTWYCHGAALILVDQPDILFSRQECLVLFRFSRSFDLNLERLKCKNSSGGLMEGMLVVRGKF